MRTYHFRPGTKYTKLAEADVKGRTRVRTVWLLDDDDVDRASESRGVDLVVKEAEIADDLGDIVHAVHVLSPRTTGRGTRSTMVGNTISGVSFEIPAARPKGNRIRGCLQSEGLPRVSERERERKI